MASLAIPSKSARDAQDAALKRLALEISRSGGTGQQLWRELARTFNAAGFDVLLYDRRGVGISTGFADTNTLQQGRDILAMIASLRSGDFTASAGYCSDLAGCNGANQWSRAGVGDRQVRRRGGCKSYSHSPDCWVCYRTEDD